MVLDNLVVFSSSKESLFSVVLMFSFWFLAICILRLFRIHCTLENLPILVFFNFFCESSLLMCRNGRECVVLYVEILVNL